MYQRTGGLIKWGEMGEIGVSSSASLDQTGPPSSDEILLRMMSIEGVGVLSFDVAGTLIGANRAFMKMSGYSGEDIAAGKLTWRGMTPPEFLEITEQRMAQLEKTGGFGPYEKEYICKDGSRSWMLFAGARVDDGTTLEYCIDVSARKRSEDMLRAAKAAAEDANRVKDEFLATLSHELRTPLGAILLWAKLLEGEGSKDAAQLREGLAAIKTSAEAQKELIEDLLDMSRITTGKLRLKPREVELAPVIRDALEAIRPAATAKHVGVSAELAMGTGTVMIDPDRIRQVVWNLLTNAVKFTPSGGRVDVELGRLDGAVEIRVRDSGQGIEPDFLPHVFERFRQADSSHARAQGGIGLGLAIAKQLVELHGGTIDADSAGTRKGATFTVHLPLPPIRTGLPRKESAAAGASSASRRKTASGLEGLKVLFVEDDRETRGAVTLLLQRRGMIVTEAESVSSAMRCYDNSPPDLILSDIGMPVEDGYMLIRRIRNEEAKKGRKRVPAIALTAFARETDRRMAIEAGFGRHLGKPVDFEEMVSAIRDVLKTDSPASKRSHAR